MVKYFDRPVRFGKYKNMMEAFRVTLLIKKICGLGVVTVESGPNNEVKSRFSLLGFTCCIFWQILYYFCAYKAFAEDQTILRGLYNTKLRHYGDVFERVVSIIFVTYAMWKIPFKLHNQEQIEHAITIDNKIEGLGVTIDHDRTAKLLMYYTLVQVATAFLRMLSVWLTLSRLRMAVPFEILIQASWSDALALVTTAHYCHWLIYLKWKYVIINDLLVEIRDQKSWEDKVLVRSKQSVNMQKAMTIQDRYVCEKIKACAGIYSLLFKFVERIRNLFGFALVCTLLFCLLYIVLYLFYFMEATASGLFHDTQKYCYFLIYVFWQIAYTFGVIYFNVYFSEDVVEEAAKTSYVLHEIINADISPAITAQAMQFSLQVIHQAPVFTACDLCRIDYMLVFEGARSITTYLVILLQFVME